MLIVKKFVEEVNNSMKQTKERHFAKKILNISRGSLSKVFIVKDYFQKEDLPQKDFFEDLGLLIIKNNSLFQFVENIWLKWLVLHLCPKLNFPSRKQHSQEILPRLVEKTKQLHVLLALVECHFVTLSFDL
jgi:hypothetical protein